MEKHKRSVRTNHDGQIGLIFPFWRWFAFCFSCSVFSQWRPREKVCPCGTAQNAQPSNKNGMWEPGCAGLCRRGGQLRLRWLSFAARARVVLVCGAVPPAAFPRAAVLSATVSSPRVLSVSLSFLGLPPPLCLLFLFLLWIPACGAALARTHPPRLPAICVCVCSDCWILEFIVFDFLFVLHSFGVIFPSLPAVGGRGGSRCVHLQIRINAVFARSAVAETQRARTTLRTLS